MMHTTHNQVGALTIRTLETGDVVRLWVGSSSYYPNDVTMYTLVFLKLASVLPTGIENAEFLFMDAVTNDLRRVPLGKMRKMEIVARVKEAEG